MYRTVKRLLFKLCCLTLVKFLVCMCVCACIHTCPVNLILIGIDDKQWNSPFCSEYSLYDGIGEREGEKRLLEHVWQQLQQSGTAAVITCLLRHTSQLLHGEALQLGVVGSEYKHIWPFCCARCLKSLAHFLFRDEMCWLYVLRLSK